MTYKYCPKCTAEGSIPEESGITHCPYCGTELKDKKVDEKDFYDIEMQGGNNE
jgi:hypothetical protein